MDLGLDGKRALVTAASRGLGRACAEALAAEGARVFIVSRDEASLKSAAKSMQAAGWRAADVARDGEPQSIVENAVAELGGLDIVVANAGGPPPGTFQSTPLDKWDSGYQLTLMSTVRLIHAALPHLKRSGQGRIVCITSISVRQPIANIVISNALRSAVTGLAKTLSLELAPHGITVNCLAPNDILTDRIRQLAVASGADVEAEIAKRAKAAPMGRLGDPTEFGAACAFLCSKQAGFITGQTVGVDGGTLVGVH